MPFQILMNVQVVHVMPMQHAIIQMAVTSVIATLGTQAMDTPAIVCYDEIKSFFTLLLSHRY